ncbi:MAG: RIP metalloprotease RseP [Kiritimatiellaceae bacterium]|nr:RIP metalloprotease RseP [Kiritimatiellaceae bacterium]
MWRFRSWIRRGWIRSRASIPVNRIPRYLLFAVAVAGPVGNVLFATVLALVIWLIPSGEVGIQIRPVVGSIETNSAAYAAGLREGDEILRVNGAVIKNWTDFTVESFLKDSDTVDLAVTQAGVERQLVVPVVIFESGERIMEGVKEAIPCVFGVVSKASPAERAGIQSGDTALSLNGADVRDWKHFTEMMQVVTPNVPAELVVDRKGEVLSLSIVPEYNEEHKRVLIGVQLGGNGFPWMNYKHPVDQLKYDALGIVRMLKALVTPAEAKQAAGGLGGPILIFDLLTMSIKMGLLNTLGLIRFLNVNLAILNLMPIPVLDGGHIVFSLWHGITRRKVNIKLQTALINLFAILLISAMLILSFKDVDRNWNVKQQLIEFFSGESPAVDEPAGVDPK